MKRFVEGEDRSQSTTRIFNGPLGNATSSEIEIEINRVCIFRDSRQREKTKVNFFVGPIFARDCHRIMHLSTAARGACDCTP